MKLKHTQAKKANRYCERRPHATTDPVWLRRVLGIYGADSKSFDAIHPRLEPAVRGIRARMDQKPAEQITG